MTRWEDVTTPKQAGGLEDKELAHFNMALLSKWIWNWLNSNNHQLSQMIPHLETADRPWEPQSTIVFWISLVEKKPFLKIFVQFQIENLKK